MAVGGVQRGGWALDDVRVVRFPWRKALWALALFLAFVAAGFVVTNTYSKLWQQRLDRTWASMVAAGGQATPVVGDPVAKIIIPSLDLERVILEGDDRSQLRKAPGHVEGTPFPGGEGNSVIRGHRLLWSGPFQDIDRLNLGAEIHTQTVEGTAVYLVAGIFRQDGPRVDMYEQTSLPYLTLVTSDPPFRADGTLVVRAAMVERNGVAV
jgi:LPXTG-site transpeptidase (sortase) family protein